MQSRQVLAREERELFKQHPDRKWLYKHNASWNVFKVDDLDNWNWWECALSCTEPAVETDVTEEMLLIMQRYEAALRLSSATQQLLSRVYHQEVVCGMSSHESVIGALQAHVVKSFGVVGSGIEAGLALLRSAQSTLSQARNRAELAVDQDEFVPHYVRFNRLRQPQVQVGQQLLDSPLHDMQGGRLKFLSTMQALSTSGPGSPEQPCPVVVVASSLT